MKNRGRAEIKHLLLKTARSFYLNLLLLPQSIQEPLSITYLLARLTDTIADKLALSTEIRLQLLDEYINSIKNNKPISADLLSLMEVDFSPEYDLFTHFDLLLSYFYSFDQDIREKILWLLEQITSGQRIDITHFDQEIHNIIALANEAELDQYIFDVAGSVGEFWTWLCCRNIKNYSDVQQKTLLDLGIKLGKGLQLINILRDLPNDIQQGRCYLPLKELRRNDIEINELKEHIADIEPAAKCWQIKTLAYLEQGWQYMLVINNRRIRASISLMLMLAFATLDKMESERFLRTGASIKVSRRRVKLLFGIALLSMFSRKFLKLTRYFSFNRLIHPA